MCGFAGILAFRDAETRVDPALLERMGAALEHRGPDGDGTWYDADCRIGLAHRRLAIIDLDRAAGQPMVSPDGRWVLAYNGEIYNHAELRRSLQEAGVTDWRTDHSDTEVLLYAFRHWGIDCLQRLRGMFAFALWDARERELWLVRDRIGIKPLYFAHRHGVITFASEIKALLCDPAQTRAMDEDALFHYLGLLTTPAPLTLFAGINKLPGGCWMRVRANGHAEQRRYWDVATQVSPLPDNDDAELARRVRGALEDAVSCHKASDVPIGVFLSGGIDSSTNAAIFSHGETQPIKTFSIGYAGDNPSYRDELDYARLMARSIGADHHELKLNESDLLDFVPRMIHLQDEPIADPVCVPLYYVARLARDAGVINCQVGEGADELFAGYGWWARVLQARRVSEFPAPRVCKRLAMRLLDALGKEQHYLREMLRRASRDEAFFFSGAEAFTDAGRYVLLSPRLRSKYAGRSSYEAIAPIRERFVGSALEQTPLNWMSYVDLNFRLPELLLMRVDKMSMGVSLECRVPFLDHRLVELAMSIPSAAKMRNGNLKNVLKLAVTGLIPEQIIARPKQGFGLPLDDWCNARLGPLMTRTVAEFCARTDVLDATAVAALMRDGSASARWRLFNLAAWHAHYIEQRDPGITL